MDFGVPGLLGNIVDQEGNPFTDPAEMFSPTFTRIRSVPSSFSPFQDTKAHVFSVAVIRNNAQRPCVRRNAVEVMMSTSLLRSSVALVFSLTAWRNISCSIFFWACSCSRAFSMMMLAWLARTRTS